ncbi:hypothetical protein L596_001645 [Steinernema carpocapsae]|uniref:Uncharacterized protein n=1 Tax=Steinernema carpocapsae TaxID=34508 RepID=A0A4U8UMC8_STECR|nr:hypothetical protein L596_001645 [Steinernema carpocapsae]
MLLQGVSFISHNNTYCSVIVDLPNFTPSRKFGIISGQTDQEEYYEGFFAIESDRYSIPLACWLEKFDFGPDGMLRSTPAELMFRCVCKTDFCNYYAPKASFQQFVTGMEPQIQF